MVLSKAAHLMHSFMQYGNNANSSITQILPVDEMSAVAEEISAHAKFGGNWSRYGIASGNSLESLEQPAYVSFGLDFAPALTRIAVDLVDMERGSLLDPNLLHTLYRLFFPITSAGVSGW